MNLENRLDAKLRPINLFESRPTACIDTINKIARSGVFTKTVSIRALADGVVGFFGAEDGQAYEVIVRPARYAQYRSLYPGGKVVSRKQMKNQSLQSKA